MTGITIVILEQTFFCALDPALRDRYVAHMEQLLAPGGKLVGVLFNDTLNADRPPFGGSQGGVRASFPPALRALSRWSPATIPLHHAQDVSCGCAP